jgi:hypothetical protein
MKSQTKSQSFEIAIVDGINIFVRTVLVARGIVPPDKVDDLGLPEIIKLKYEVARSLAKDWAKMPMHDDPGQLDQIG